MISAVLIALSLAAPTTMTSGTGGERPSAPILEETVASSTAAPAPLLLQLAANSVDPIPDEDPGFVDKYMGISLNQYASKQAKDSQVLSIVVGYVLWGLCAPLWAPIAFTDDAEFSGDVVLTWLLSNIIWTVISTAASFTGIGLLIWLAIPYFSTTAVLNEVDRGIRRRGLGIGGDPRKTGPTNKQPAAPPPDSTDTPPPSYAY